MRNFSFLKPQLSKQTAGNIKSSQLSNRRFEKIWQCIRTAKNQLHLDKCRSMIESWFLNEGLIKKAKELISQIQIREAELLLIDTHFIEK